MQRELDQLNLEVARGDQPAAAERLVAPLARPKAGEPFAGRLTPKVDVQGQPLAVVLPRITPLNLRLLSGRIANLGQHRHAIVQALDLLYAGV